MEVRMEGRPSGREQEHLGEAGEVGQELGREYRTIAVLGPDLADVGGDPGPLPVQQVGCRVSVQIQVEPGRPVERDPRITGIVPVPRPHRKRDQRDSGLGSNGGRHPSARIVVGMAVVIPRGQADGGTVQQWCKACGKGGAPTVRISIGAEVGQRQPRPGDLYPRRGVGNRGLGQTSRHQPASSRIGQVRVGHLAVGGRHHPDLDAGIGRRGQRGPGGQELVVGVGGHDDNRPGRRPGGDLGQTGHHLVPLGGLPTGHRIDRTERCHHQVRCRVPPSHEAYNPA